MQRWTALSAVCCRYCRLLQYAVRLWAHSSSTNFVGEQAMGPFATLLAQSRCSASCLPAAWILSHFMAGRGVVFALVAALLVTAPLAIVPAQIPKSQRERILPDINPRILRGGSNDSSPSGTSEEATQK